MTVIDDMRALGPACESLGWLDCGSLEAELATLLPEQTWACTTGHSRLNGNGSPVELCVSAKNDQVSGRLLVDPCHLLRKEARFNGAWEVALSLCERRAPTLASSLSTTLELMMSWCSPEHFVNGPLWLATVPGASGMAVYFDAKPLERDASRHIDSWLLAIAPETRGYFAALLKPDAGVQLASFGIEGADVTDARVKIYFRLEDSTTLQSIGVPELYSQPMLDWLASAIPGGEIDSSGLVLSISAPLQGKGETDAKIDICGHCANHSLQQWDEIFEGTNSAGGLPSLAQHLDTDKVAVAFAGLGVSSSLVTRVNVYLQALR